MVVFHTLLSHRSYFNERYQNESKHSLYRSTSLTCRINANRWMHTTEKETHTISTKRIPIKKTFIQPFKVVLVEAIAVSLTVDAFLMNFIHLTFYIISVWNMLIPISFDWTTAQVSECECVLVYFKWTTLFESNRNVKVCQRERN